MTPEQSTIVEHRIDVEGIDPLLFTGVNDTNMQEVSRIFSIRMILRGDHVILSGDLLAVEQAAPVVQHLVELSRLRVPFDSTDISRFAEGFSVHGDRGVVTPDDSMGIALPGTRKVIRPKSEGQRRYLTSILDNDIVIGIGPAGTGKTYLAVAAAVDALYINRI